jgi:hypothetical protein
MLPDGSVPPSGTQLATGDVTLVGVTSDNYAIYAATSSSMLNAVPLAGGMPTELGTSNVRVIVNGSVVLMWTGGANGRVGQLSTWTSASGVKMLSTSSYSGATAAAVSPDGSRVMYFDGVDTGRTVGNLVVARTDGSSTTNLASGVALSMSGCAPALAFGGNTAAAAALCFAPPSNDGGAPGDGGAADGATADAAAPEAGTPDAGAVLPAIVQTYSGANWTATTVATNVQPRVTISPTGTAVVVNSAAGLVGYPITGGTAIPIDATGVNSMFTSDGSSILFTTTANELKRATIGSPTVTTLATTGFANFRAKSADDKWVLGYITLATGDLSDLYLASATTAGTPTTLSSTVTAGLFTSDGFTRDSSHALFYTDIANGIAPLHSLALPPAGTPATHSSTVWIHQAATGSKVAFSDNYSSADNTADIRSVDTAGTAAPTLIVSLADADFFVSGSKDKVVYVWNYLAGSMAGLWVTAIP